MIEQNTPKKYLSDMSFLGSPKKDYDPQAMMKKFHPTMLQKLKHHNRKKKKGKKKAHALQDELQEDYNQFSKGIKNLS